MRVSIIIPIYNVECFLDECIQSALSQSYKDLEIILVDDASPDECPKICDEYALQDVRIKVVHHLDNRGLSAARNSGMKIATGEYIYFLDSDDKIYPHSIASLIALAEKYPGVDIVQGNYEMNGAHNYYSDKISRQPQYIAYDGGARMPSFMTCPASACNKLIRRKLLADNGITFVEGILHEDQMFRWDIHRLVKTVAFVKDFTYWRSTDNPSSILTATKKAILMYNSVLILEKSLDDDIVTKEEIYWAVRLLSLNRGQVKESDIAEYHIQERLADVKRKYSLPLPLRMEVCMWSKYFSLYHNNTFHAIYLLFRKVLLQFYR